MDHSGAETAGMLNSAKVEKEAPSDFPARSTAQFVVKNSFLELVEERPAVRWSVRRGTKSESELPDLRVRSGDGLSDDDTDIESCGGSPDFELEESDTEVGSWKDEQASFQKRRSWSDLQDEDEERQSSNGEGSDSGSQTDCKSDYSKSDDFKVPKVEIPAPPCPSVFEALPAISAAAAAAAFDAAGLSPDVLQNLLQEQQRDTVPEAIATPSTKPSGNSIPLVISVADALAPAKPRDTRTTVMLRNLPNNYTRLMVVNLLNQEGFKGKFDFLYLPIDFRSKAGLGYAFVNLCDPSYVQQFWKTFDGFTKWVLPSSKVCQVSWSGPHQGQAAHVERYRSSPIMHSSVPDECKPIVLLDGERVDFPEALKKIRAPRQRK